MNHELHAAELATQVYSSRGSARAMAVSEFAGALNSLFEVSRPQTVRMYIEMSHFLDGDPSSTDLPCHTSNELRVAVDNATNTQIRAAKIVKEFCQEERLTSLAKMDKLMADLKDIHVTDPSLAVKLYLKAESALAADPYLNTLQVNTPKELRAAAREAAAEAARKPGRTSTGSSAPELRT